MAREARQQSSSTGIILDHIKERRLNVDEDGTIRTFNLRENAYSAFGEAEVVGRRIDLLIPPYCRT